MSLGCNTSWLDMSFMNGMYGFGSYSSFGSCGFGGMNSIFCMDPMNLAGMYDYNAMAGWGVANMLTNVVGGVACKAVQSHKAAKAEENAELKKAKDNVKSTQSGINSLETENQNLNNYLKSIDNNIVAITKLFPTEGAAYTTAKEAKDSFKTYNTADTHPDFKNRITAQNDEITKQVAIKNDNTKTDAEKTAADAAIKAAKAKILEIQAEYNDAKAKAEREFEKAEAKLNSTIRARIDENNAEIKKKEDDLKHAKSDLADSTANNDKIDDQFNTDDGNSLNRSSAKTVESRFSNGILDANYDSKNAEDDFKGALSQYRKARSENNTGKMELWGERALALYEKLSPDKKTEYKTSKNYIDTDKGSSGEKWARRANAFGL